MRRRRNNSLAKYIAFSIAVLLLYTAISLVYAYRGIEVPDTLTVAFFGAFGGEILTCGLIKIFKLKGENEL